MGMIFDNFLFRMNNETVLKIADINGQIFLTGQLRLLHRVAGQFSINRNGQILIFDL